MLKKIIVEKNICKYNIINIIIRYVLNIKKVVMIIGVIFVLVFWGKLF